MNARGIAGMIRTQPDRQTGPLGAALKAKLAEEEQGEQQSESVTMTLTPLPDSQRLAFKFEREGHPTRRGNFINAAIAAHVIDGLLNKHPNLTVIRRELPQ